MRRASLNHVYRLVWNELTRSWVAVAECVRAKGMRNGSVPRLAHGLLFAYSLLLAAPSYALDTTALPAGGSISAGSGEISQSGAAMTIGQTSQNLAINWQTYNVGQSAVVTYNQPDSSAIALNRVLGTDGSQILGQIKANGQVWILNPNGVLFGETAQVNVGGLVASTLNLSDADFLAGKRSFAGSGGTVENQGSIGAAYVALLGGQVENSGNIVVANLGTAALAAGNQITLDFSGDQLLNVQVDAGAFKALAENSGLIQADGGTILMTTQAEDALLDTAVNNTGILQARSIENHSGVIELLGDMQSGTVEVGGTLDASAPTAGDGGFIETSAAHVQVADDAVITTQAAPGSGGKTGQWLIDPDGFTIAASGGDMSGSTLSSELASTDVIIQSTLGSGTDGDVNVDDAVNWSSHLLTLSATNDININAQMNGSGSAGLALEYGQGAVAAGNTANYYVNAPVNLSSTGSFSTKLGSNGTVTDYTILTSLGAAGSTTGTDLQGINGNLAGNYVLGADIDASATSGWNSGAGFSPIGGTTAMFTGSLDGLGHSVDGLAALSYTTWGGLFGMNSGTIRNLGLTDVNIQTRYGAALAGVNYGKVYNVYSTGSIGSTSDGYEYNAGLVSENFGNISFCSSSATVHASFLAGGLVAWNRAGSITNSFATGDLIYYLDDGSNYGPFMGEDGGLVGENDAAISDAYSTGKVYGGHDTGGLVGYNTVHGTISNVYSTSTMYLLPEASGTIDPTSGGIVGENAGGTVSQAYYMGIQAWQPPSLTNIDISYNVQWMESAVGSGSCTDCYFAGRQYIDPSNPANYSVLGSNDLPWSAMTQMSTYAGFNITSDGSSSAPWRIYEGDTTPLLTAFLKPVTIVPSYDGSGTAMNDLTDYVVTSGGPVDSGKISVDNANGGLLFASGGADGYALSFTQGIYSTQDGYNLVYAPKTIGTPGSAAGDITLPQGLNWSNGDVDIAASGRLVQGGSFNWGSGDVSIGTGADFAPAGGYSWTTGNLSISSPGALTLSQALNWTTGDLTLAAGALSVNAPLNWSTGNLTINTGGDFIQDTAWSWNSGNLSIAANGALTLASPLTWTTGDLTLDAGSALNVDTPLNWTTGNLSLSAGTALALNMPLSWSSGDASLVSAGDISLGNSLSWSSGTLSLNPAGSLALTSGADVSGDVFDLRSGNWTQVGANLPGFSVVDFRVDAGATFLRALGGNGSVATPYQLTDIYGVQGMGTSGMLGDSYALANDIDASGTSNWNDGAGFVPVGSASADFSGSLDGVGHTLSGLQINRGGSDQQGLFGVLSTAASVADLALTQATVTGGTQVGLVAGSSAGAISKVSADGSVTGAGDVGGLVGYNSGAMSQVVAAATVSSAGGSNLGGLAGYNDTTGRIDTATATGSVDSSGVSGPSANAGGGNLGGLVGFNAGSITNSQATGNVASQGGDSEAGSNGGDGGDDIGGLVGSNSGAIAQAHASGAVSSAGGSSSLAMGGGSGGNDVGGLVGANAGGSITNAYATGGVSATGGNGGIGLNSVNPSQPNGNDGGAGGGGGSNLGGLAGSNTGAGQISNAYAAGDVASVGGDGGAGGMGYVWSPSQQVAGQSGAGGAGGAGASNLGGLVGSNTNQGQITQAFATGNVSSVGGHGGDGGAAYVQFTLSGLDVSTSGGPGGNGGAGGSNLGGLVGDDSYFVINAYATGNASSQGGSAGLIATPNEGSWSNPPGTVNTVGAGGNNIGGLAGFVSGRIAYAYSTGSSVSRDGSGAATATAVGGFVGNSSNSVIESSFWDTESSGTGTGIGSNNASVSIDLSGETTAEMEQLATFTAKGWSIDDAGGTGNTWRIYGGNSMPLLRSLLTPLTITATSGDKVFDGSTDGLGFTYSTTPDTSLLFGTLDSTLPSKNVGTYAVTIGNLYSNQFGYDISTVNGSVQVTPEPLTVSTDNVTKTYDGTTTALGTTTLTGGTLYGSDSISGGTFAFTNANAGVGDKTVTVSGVSVNDGNGGSNYNVTYVDNTTSTINPADLTIGLSGNVVKTYDGTTQADGTATVVGGTLYANASNGGATDSISGGSFAFTNANAGVGDKTVTVSGVSVNDGNGGSNYNVTYVDNTTSTINPADLTIGLSGNVVKTYDGTTQADGTAAVVGGTLYANASNGGATDSISGGTFAFTNANAGVGDKTVTVSGVSVNDGNGGSNYNVTYVDNTTSTINPADLTIGLSGNVVKTYDGTTQADGTAAVVGGTLYANASNGGATDSISGGSFAFTNANAGVGDKTVTVSGVSVNDGNGGSNYNVTYVDNTTSTINPADLTIGLSGNVVKTYDGTTQADGTATVVGGTLYANASNGGATDSISGGSFAFTNANAGVGDKTVTVSGVSVNDGNGGSNYNVTYVDNTTSTINPADLTIGLSGNVVKTYDGTTQADGTAAVVGGTLYANASNGGATDSISGGTFAFTNANAGVGDKTVTVSGVSVNDGNGGSNYNVTYVDNTTSTINPADLTIGLSGNVVKTYDGTTQADGTAAVVGGTLYANASNGGATDSISGGTFAFTNANAGVGDKTVTVSGVSVNDGNGGSNYNVTYVDNTTSTINPADLTIGLSGNVVKTYDGTTQADGTAAVVNGTLYANASNGGATDSISGGTFAFTDKNAGTNKTVTVSGVTVDDGNGGNNYAVTYVADTTGVIDPKSLTLTAPVVTKTYDGTIGYTTSATDLTDLSAQLGVAGDSVTAATIVYADPAIGTGKTVDLSAVSISDGNGGNNYLVSLTGNASSAIVAPGVPTVPGAPAGGYTGAVNSATSSSTGGTTGSTTGGPGHSDDTAGASMGNPGSTTTLALMDSADDVAGVYDLPGFAIIDCGQKLPINIDNQCR